MKVLVSGATGSQAKPLVFQLLENGYEVFALTRNVEAVDDFKNTTVQLIQGDLEKREDVLRAMKGMDVLAMHIPFFMQNPETAAQNLVDAAKEAAIRKIVWNTAGIILPFDTGNPAYDVRRSTKKLWDESGIDYVTLQPTVYAENLLGPWTAPFVKNENKVTYPVPKDFKIGWLPSTDMAKAMVAAIDKPELIGKSFVISGKETLNGYSLSKAFSEGLEREIEYAAMQPKDFGEILDQIMGEGSGDAVAKEYQAIWDGKANPIMYHDMEDTLKELNIQFTDLRDWVKSFSSLF